MCCCGMCGNGRVGLQHRLHARWNAELGEGAGQLGTAPKPSGGLEWLSEAALAWRRVDDRPAERYPQHSYTCRPPGVVHGPFKSDTGCLLLEIHYFDPEESH